MASKSGRSGVDPERAMELFDLVSSTRSAFQAEIESIKGELKTLQSDEIFQGGSAKEQINELAADVIDSFDTVDAALEKLNNNGVILIEELKRQIAKNEQATEALSDEQKAENKKLKEFVEGK